MLPGDPEDLKSRVEEAPAGGSAAAPPAPAARRHGADAQPDQGGRRPPAAEPLPEDYEQAAPQPIGWSLGRGMPAACVAVLLLSLLLPFVLKRPGGQAAAPPLSPVEQQQLQMQLQIEVTLKTLVPPLVVLTQCSHFPPA